MYNRNKIAENIMSNDYRGKQQRSGKDSQKERKQAEQEPSGIIVEIYEDFLPASVKSSGDYKKRFQVITVVGSEKFSILRIYLKKSMNTLARGEEIDLSKLKNNFQLVRKLRPSDWSTTLKDDIEEIIDRVISNNEVKYVDFFNKAHAITNRLHQLKLLPNVGDKRVVQILKIRDQQEFINFIDIGERVGLNPVELIRKRVIEELETDQKYVLFTKRYEH